MAERIYVAPLTLDAPAKKVADALAQILDTEAQPVFSGDLSRWLTAADACQSELAVRAGSGKAVFDASLPTLPMGGDVMAFHAAAAPHVNAAVVAVISAGSLTQAQLDQSVQIAAKRFEQVGVTLLGMVALGASPRPAKGEVPLISLAGDDADVLRAALAPLVHRRVDVKLSPVAFQHRLVETARANKKTIVLPESNDDRVLHAVDRLVKLDAANLVLLGEEKQVRERARELGLELGKTRIVSPSDPELAEDFAQELARLRAKKGMTVEQARKQVSDVSYFGTMMIQLGEADGMVSGACHTTAETIRPALQIIKTTPDVSTVSGAFLMLLRDRQYVFADCAVTIQPTAAQLADIAASSAKTAEAFGVEPRVAMISYSTGSSGSGSSVDLVKEATELARSTDPQLKIDGPLQFDAAVDQAVAAKKCPDSAVAGKATVFVFNHLDVGNCTYKAVQRTAGAVAVGPILQGLRKPVNDLSRGALVEDIVNTVIITAIQAQRA